MRAFKKLKDYLCRRSKRLQHVVLCANTLEAILYCERLIKCFSCLVGPEQTEGLHECELSGADVYGEAMKAACCNLLPVRIRRLEYIHSTIRVAHDDQVGRDAGIASVQHLLVASL